MRRRSGRIVLLLTAAVAVPVLAATGCSQDSGRASAPPSASQGPSGSSGSSGSSAEEAEMAKKVRDAERAADDADADAAEDAR